MSKRFACLLVGVALVLVPPVARAAAKKRVEVNTRHWTLFRHREIAEAFGRCGFVQQHRCGQFFFPMVLHRMMRCRPLSQALEAGARVLGLTRWWGSPVIVEMVPHTT